MGWRKTWNTLKISCSVAPHLAGWLVSGWLGACHVAPPQQWADTEPVRVEARMTTGSKALNVEQVLLQLTEQVAEKRWPDTVASLRWLQKFHQNEPLRANQLQRWQALQAVVGQQLVELSQTSPSLWQQRYWLLLRSQLQLLPVESTLDVVQANHALGQQEKTWATKHRQTHPGSAAIAAALAYHLGARFSPEAIGASWQSFTQQLCTSVVLEPIGWPAHVSRKLWQEPFEQALQHNLQPWLRPCARTRDMPSLEIQVDHVLLLEQQATWPGAVPGHEFEPTEPPQEQLVYLLPHVPQGQQVATTWQDPAIPLLIGATGQQPQWLIRQTPHNPDFDGHQVRFERSLQRRMVRLILQCRIAGQAPLRLVVEQEIADQGHPSLIVAQELRPADRIELQEMSVLMQQAMQQMAHKIALAWLHHQQQVSQERMTKAQGLRQHDLGQATEIALQHWALTGQWPVAFEGIMLERYGMTLQSALIQLATALGVEPLLLPSDGSALRQALLPTHFVQPILSHP